MSTTTPGPVRPGFRWGRWLFAALTVPVLLLIAAVIFVIGSERGLRFGLAQLNSLTGGMISVGRVDGRLLDKVELHDFRYTGSDGLLITIGRLRLRHQPASLLRGRLHAELIEIDALAVTPGRTTEPAPPPTPTRLPARLPVDVVIDSATLTGFVLHAAADAPAGSPDLLAIDSTQLIGRWLGRQLSISQLQTSGLPITGPLQAQAEAQMGAEQIDFEQLTVTGAGPAAGGYRLHAKGRYGLNTVASALKLEWTGLRWPLVLEDQQPPMVSDLIGAASFDGRLDDYRYTLAASATMQAFSAKLATAGSGSLSSARIDSLKLDALPVALAAIDHKRKAAPQPGSISASGEVRWSPALSAEIVASFEHVDPSWFVADFPGDLNGRITTTTHMVGEEPQIAFDGRFENSSLRGQPFSLVANGVTDTRAAQLEALKLAAGKGKVEASGKVRWTPELKLNFQALISHLDPGLVAPDWPGDINGKLLIATGDAAAAPLRFDALIDQSRLRNYPLKLAAVGSAQLAPESTVVTLDTVQLESGRTVLNLSGQATPPFALRGSFNSPALGSLLPELSGHAAFDFALDGSIEQPHLVSKGELGKLAFGEQTVEHLDWVADLDPLVATSNLKVTLRGAEVGLKIASASLTATGQEVYHGVLLEADTERGHAKLGLQGGYDRLRGEWGGELNQLSLAPDGLSAWALDKPAGILVGEKRRALELACLTGNDGHACFNLEQNVLADGARIGWNIDRLLLSALQPFLDPKMRISGSVDGSGSIDFTSGNLQQAEASLNLREASLQLPDAPLLSLQTGSVQARQVDGRLEAKAELKMAGAALDATLTAAPGDDFKARALGGSIRLDVPGLAFLEPLLPQVDKLDGHLAGNFTLSGTVGKPRVEGDLKLSEGRAKLVIAGIEVTDIGLVLRARNQAPLALDGSLSSGGGTLSIAGTVDPYSKPLSADVTIKGKDVQAMNTAEARAWIDADLRLIRNAEGARLTGELGVPRADITPKGLGGNSGIDASEDQVLVGVVVPPKEVPLPVFVDLRLVLGNKVGIEGFGLKTRIEGGVTVSQRPGFDALGRGELRLIDGRYQAYGQDLNIETGRLIFSGGPVKTPAVDLYATRQPREDIKVGVRVRGTLAKPELSLQSSPTLPREQQLSWLVLGRSLDNSSSQDRSLVSSAALSLGLGGGDYLAGLLGKKVGLDELSVGNAAANNSEVAANAQSISGSQSAAGVDAGAQAAQLTLGKYLTPRLFVSYGISLFQEGYTFRMLYTLGHGFKLSTESGTASGGDIIYTTERGKKDPTTASKPGIDAVPQAGPAPDPDRSHDAIKAKPVLEREPQPAAKP
ncbi:MAG: translocation/assembly module TamB domain-containing protein [Nevskia sp.]|nr:translocation/assembly module TamB domain-containing protein [Nevskia sp.]